MPANPTKPRNPADVIDAILKHISEDKVELRAKLAQVKFDSGYLAPEHKQPAWYAIGVALNKACNLPPKLDWEKRVSAIVEGRAED